MRRARLFISEIDFQRLSSLVDSAKRFFCRDREHIDVLEEELNRAEIVPAKELRANVVTMNSRVRLRDLDTGTQVVYTLAFPHQADITQNRVSVLAPIGAAILGYRAGAVVCACVPGGRKRLKIEEVMRPTSTQSSAA